jgi:hypothetical protein
MREIKFRAYDKKLKRYIEEAEGFHVIGECMMFGIIEIYCNCNKSDANSSVERLGDIEIQQFTGLLDRDGVEIYEGDIVSEGSGECEGSITYSEKRARFEYKTPTAVIGLYGFYGKVIGNIYENPELLKGEYRVMANLSLKGLDDDTHMALKVMAAEKRTSITALVTEAFELLFAMESGGKVSGRGLVRGKRGKG